MPPKPQEPQRLEIRKYPNRRYYDATRSRHLTLEEIHAAIREGYEISVVESSTGEDITGKVLAQIIIDLDPPKLEVFPVPMLHGLLRANQKMVGDFIQKYFNQPLAMFLDSQRNFENYLRNAMGLPGGVPTMADWTRMMWGPLAAGSWAGGAPKAPPVPPGSNSPAAEEAGPPVPPVPPATPVPPSAEPTPETADDHPEQQLRSTVERLSRQLEELESRIARKPARKTKKAR